jgi:hypothetical protein
MVYAVAIKDVIMKVDILVAADYANVADGGKINIMGIFGKIYSSTFPARHAEMYLVAKISARPSEYGTKRQLTVKLMDEDGKIEILNFSNEIVVPTNDKGETVQIHQILRLVDIVFPSAGTYQFSILIDNDEKASYPIELELTPAQRK